MSKISILRVLTLKNTYRNFGSKSSILALKYRYFNNRNPLKNATGLSLAPWRVYKQENFANLKRFSMAWVALKFMVFMFHALKITLKLMRISFVRKNFLTALQKHALNIWKHILKMCTIKTLFYWKLKKIKTNYI